MTWLALGSSLTLVRTIQSLLLGCVVLAGGFVNSTQAAEKRELLAKQETVAEFTGLKFQKCRGLTSLCPDKCGNSGNVAKFRIIKYLVYEKPGQYGDPQVTEFLTQVDDNLGNLKLPQEQVELLRALKPGDFVRLAWRHDYVTKDGASSPERPLTKVEKLTEAAAAKLAGEVPLKAPAGQATDSPLQPMAF